MRGVLSRTVGVACLSIFLPAQLSGAGEPTANSMLISIERVDDSSKPADAFQMSVDVVVCAVAGVTSVVVEAPDATEIAMVQDAEECIWGDDASLSFSSLAALQSFAHGTWTVHIIGRNPGTSTFALSGLQDSDFFAAPLVLAPADGATEVSPDIVFAWQAPAFGPFPAWLVHVNTDLSTGDSVADLLDAGATQWNPPVSLPDGATEFDVAYFVTGLSAGVSVGEFNVVEGAMSWSAHELAPDGYPEATPLVVLGGQTLIGFTVAACRLVADINCDGVVDETDRALLCGVLGASERDPVFLSSADIDDNGVIDELDQQLFNEVLPPCAGDIVTSGTFAPPPDGIVDGADLAYLLGAWGDQPSCADMVLSATFQPPPGGSVDGADLAYLLGAWGMCP